MGQVLKLRSSDFLSLYQGQHSAVPNTFCLPCTGFWEMLTECQLGSACPGSLYPPLPIVCFTHLHYLPEVQSQVHFQGHVLDSVVTTVTKPL